MTLNLWGLLPFRSNLPPVLTLRVPPELKVYLGFHQTA